MKKKSNPCPSCGKGTLSRGVREQVHTYKGKSFSVKQPGSWCDTCNDGLLEPGDLQATNQAIHDAWQQIDGLLTSGEVKAIRANLGLTQAQANTLFGGGHNAFSRYERGEAAQPRATDLMLRLLQAKPNLLATINALQKRTPLAGSRSVAKGRKKGGQAGGQSILRVTK